MLWTPAAGDVSHQHDAIWSFVPSVYNLTIFDQSYVPKWQSFPQKATENSVVVVLRLSRLPS